MPTISGQGTPIRSGRKQSSLAIPERWNRAVVYNRQRPPRTRQLQRGASLDCKMTYGQASAATPIRTAFVALGAIALSGCAAQEAVRPPNVVFILADDLGWSDTGLYGSEFYETPNIDALAERGMMFTNAYAAAALCSPTRASILTGLHPARIGMTIPNGHVEEVILDKSLQPRGRANHPALMARSVSRLDLEYFTLAEALKAAGYETGHFGKWHLGREPYDPLSHGFDVDLPHTPGPSPGGGYFAPWRFWPGKGEDGEHIEDRMAAEASDFMRRNKDRPFLLNYWCFSVHAPIEGKPELVEKYRAKGNPDNPQRNPINGAMVETLDDAVGTLVGTIDELGIADDTVIVFFSDNGGIIHRFDGGVAVTSNAPLRSGKSSIYEGGVREPLVFVWPGTVEPGSRSDAIVQSIDFYPTLLGSHRNAAPSRHRVRRDQLRARASRGAPGPGGDLHPHSELFRRNPAAPRNVRAERRLETHSLPLRRALGRLTDSNSTTCERTSARRTTWQSRSRKGLRN